MTEKRGSGKEWYYPALEEAMDAAGLHPKGVYIKRWQTTIAYRVSCCPIYEIFTEAEHMPGTIWKVRWWNQYAVNELEK